ncbi:endonuclease/exonuclease/phosphatase family protein [Nakamurella sp. GG22]
MPVNIRKPVNATALALGWVLAAAMAGIGLVRLFRSESQPQLIGLQGVGMWLLLPAIPLALAAALTRKRALAAVAVALALGNVVWVGGLYQNGGGETAVAGSVGVHLITANMLLDNTDVAGLSADLLATDAEVIALQEVTPENLAGLRAAGLLAAYPHQVLDPLPEFHGSAILSKLPIAAGGVIDVAGSPMTRADIVTAAATFRLINVHTVAPLGEVDSATWRAQLSALAAMPGEFGGPLVMAGDFNATADHAPMADLLRSGVRDAYVVAGSGVGATWPQWAGPMIPVMRLDHVLVDGGVTVRSAQVQHNPGSDHRRLSVELAIPPAVRTDPTPA